MVFTAPPLSSIVGPNTKGIEVKRSRKAKIKRREKRPTKLVTGVAWYSRNQWDRLLSVASDRASLEDIYDDWVHMAEKALSDIRQTGLNLVKVPIDVEELINWCREKGRPVDGAARAEFAQVKLVEGHQEKGQQNKQHAT